MNILVDDRVRGYVKISALFGELRIEHIKMSRKNFPYISFIFPNEWVVYISKEERLRKLFDLLTNLLPNDSIISFDDFCQQIYSKTYDESKMIRMFSLCLLKIRYPVIFKCKVYHDQIFVYELVDEKAEEIPYWEQRKVTSSCLSDLGLKFSERMDGFSPVWVSVLGMFEVDNGLSCGEFLENVLIIKSAGNLGKTLLTFRLESVSKNIGNKYLLSRVYSVLRTEGSEEYFKGLLHKVIDIHKLSMEIFQGASMVRIEYDDGQDWIEKNLSSILKIKRDYMINNIKTNLCEIYRNFYNESPTVLSLGKSLSMMGTFPEADGLNEKMCRRLQTKAYDVLSSFLK